MDDKFEDAGSYTKVQVDYDPTGQDRPIKVSVDGVDHPPHYGGDVPHELIKCMEAWNPTGAYWFCRYNAIKYLQRAGGKDDALKDHGKAAWYAGRAKAILERSPSILAQGKPSDDRFFLHCMDIYRELGVTFGDDIFAQIKRLKQGEERRHKWSDVEPVVAALHNVLALTHSAPYQKGLELAIAMLGDAYHREQK